MLEFLDLLSFLILVYCIYLLSDRIKKLNSSVEKQRENYDSEILELKVEHDFVVDSLMEKQSNLYYLLKQQDKLRKKLNNISELIRNEKAFTEQWHAFTLLKEELKKEIDILDKEINNFKKEINK